MDNRLLADLVQMDSPKAVLEEVQVILGLISHDFDPAPAISAFKTTVSLYGGTFPGYRACNTEYHNLRHTTDCFIAMARLTHGAILEQETFTHRNIAIGLIAALFHDVGYIQEQSDTGGTGAKHTLGHVRRSMDFLERHGSEQGLTGDEIEAGRLIILCTDLTVDIHAIPFPSSETALLGRILGSADILAQMADRTYLEKLLFLYHEFREAKVGDYENELDLLNKSVGFFDYVAGRLNTALDNTNRFMLSHFASRWDMHKDLYQESIRKQKEYLQHILETSNSDPRDYLKRDGIVKKVREKYT